MSGCLQAGCWTGGDVSQSEGELYGAGEVGVTAGIHVYLFDTPNFSDGAMPVGWKSAYQNDEVLSFSGLSNSPAYQQQACFGVWIS